MLAVGYAILLVIDNLSVAIEREPILNVAAHAEYGYCLIGGRQRGQSILKVYENQ